MNICAGAITGEFDVTSDLDQSVMKLLQFFDEPCVGCSENSYPYAQVGSAETHYFPESIHLVFFTGSKLSSQSLIVLQVDTRIATPDVTVPTLVAERRNQASLIARLGHYTSPSVLFLMRAGLDCLTGGCCAYLGVPPTPPLYKLQPLLFLEEFFYVFSQPVSRYVE
ncbi:hypothetical protein Tco_0487830 [Tanacetum coccineum]